MRSLLADKDFINIRTCCVLCFNIVNFHRTVSPYSYEAFTHCAVSYIYHCKQSCLTPVHLSLQNALRHALLCTEPTAQPVLLSFSEPEETSALFNPVVEVVQVGGVHLEQEALITHHYDYEGEPIAM